MKRVRNFSLEVVVLSAAALAGSAQAENFSIPGGDLKSALATYAGRTGLNVLYLDDDIKGAKTKGVTGDVSRNDALSQILRGTGFIAHR